MALLRKAGSLLGRSVSNHFSRDDITLLKPSIFQAVRWMSSSKVFVGGISYSTDDSSLREAFSRYGQVAEARVIVDRESGRSRGFGFVTFTSGEEASAAIQAMDQQELHGRQIRVNYANDRARGYGGGYGGDGGNYGGGGGSYGGSYGGGGGGYGGNYNSGGDGGGSYNSGGYGGGSNYNSSVGSYASGGGTNDGFDSRTSAASSGGGGGGYDVFGDGSDKSNNNGEDFGMDEGASFADRDDDMDNYVNKRS